MAARRLALLIRTAQKKRKVLEVRQEVKNSHYSDQTQKCRHESLLRSLVSFSRVPASENIT